MRAPIWSNGSIWASVAFFSCDAFFAAAAPPAVTCGPDGTWRNKRRSVVNALGTFSGKVYVVVSHRWGCIGRGCSSVLPPAGRSHPCSARSGAPLCFPDSRHSAGPRRPEGSTETSHCRRNAMLLQEETEVNVGVRTGMEWNGLPADKVRAVLFLTNALNFKLHHRCLQLFCGLFRNPQESCTYRPEALQTNPKGCFGWDSPLDLTTGCYLLLLLAERGNSLHSVT